VNTQPLEWQDSQWRQLCGLQALDRLPHGLMLSGPAEIGKHRFAQAFAQFLLCLAPVEGRACQGCKSCLLYRAQSHPDFLAIEPEAEGKAIKVDQIRQLAEFATRTAAMGFHRVILVSPAEAMNLNAANAFLKTLEEPGAGVVILLVAHQAGLILPTIRSRCRILSFPLPDRSQVTTWLNGIEPDLVKVAEVMTLSGGRPFRAKRLLETELKDQLALFQDTLAGLERQAVSPLDAAKVLQGLSNTDVVEWFQYRVYDIVKAGASDAGRHRLALFKFLDRLTTARQRLTSTANPNGQLLWEEVLMDWKSVIDLQP
jgi:DNA polymerase III subunit delta'